MAIKIYSSDNYVVVEDGSNVYEYAKGHTIYVFKDGVYTIKELTQGEYKVTQEQLSNGDIVDNAGAYNETTFVTFLRQNTGFKTAAGGSAAAPVGATLMKTGQTTSYRTGDDGDIEAGRATNFFTLASNNPFGNTGRFTDELGGQTYTNNIVIDWSTYNGSTVLGLSRINIATGVNWNDAIDNCLAYSIGTFTSGWRLPNMKEIFNLMNYANPPSSFINYSPINLSQGGRLYWSSNTVMGGTTSAYGLNNVGMTAQFVKTGTTALTYFPVRTFTVTGTILS